MQAEDRVLPCDLEAEQMLLGACLRDREVFLDASKYLRPDDFSSFAGQKLWQCYTELASAGTPIMPVSVWEWVVPHGLTADISVEYIRTLFNDWTSHDMGVYARVIKKKSSYRKLIRLLERATEDAYAQTESPEDIMAGLEQGLVDIGVSHSDQQPVEMRQVVNETLETLDRRRLVATGQAAGDSVMSGWTSLDNLTGGFFNSEMTVIAARPSVGKTLVALCVADFAASCGKRVLFASIEQRRTELGERMMSRRSRVNSHLFRTASFSSDDEKRVLNAAEDLKALPIIVDDPAEQDVLRIASNARRMKMRGGLDMIIVDYLQIVFALNERANRNDQVAGISRGLKKIARELKVPVIALAQLNRQAANGEPPKLSELRESGAIEQDADTVIMLHKPQEDEHAAVEPLEFWVRKQRNGARGVVKLEHHKRYFDIRETVL